MAKYLFEFKQLIKIGVPIFGSQLSYTLMGATDTIIAGRASANDLAGLAVGTAFSNTIWFFLQELFLQLLQSLLNYMEQRNF